MQVPVFLFLFLAPVYVPRELLGGWVHAVAPFNPATHVMETVRELIAGTGSDYLATLGIVAALLAAVFVFAITRFAARRSRRLDRAEIRRSARRFAPSLTSLPQRLRLPATHR